MDRNSPGDRQRGRRGQRRARRRRLQLPPPAQVAEAFAVPNLDRNRCHFSVQIQLKRTYFTG